MTVASQKAMSGPYLGNGLTTNFDYNFKIFDKSHVAVMLHKGGGERQQLIEGVDYTVAGVGADGGGQIMLNAPPVAGEEVTIIRNLPFVQEMDLENQGAFYAEVIERAVDEGAMRDQQLKEKLDRAITVPENVAPAAKDDLVRDIRRLGESVNKINMVADNIGAISDVALIADDISTVAGFDVAAIINAQEFAYLWAVGAQGIAVNDGVHGQGYSAYHWAKQADLSAQAADLSAAAAATIADFDPATKLDKAGGVVTGDLSVGGTLKGNEWQAWGSEDAKSAIEARIEDRATAIADAKIAAALAAFKNNPEFVGTLKVTGEIKSSGDIKAFTS